MSAHEQTRAEHAAQHRMVVRSMLLAPGRTDRGEERVRPRRVPAPVVVAVSSGHVFVVPTVTERSL